MASPPAPLTNGSTSPQVEMTSFRKRIGINKELFDMVMNSMEKEFNMICSKNGSIYFCSYESPVGLVLNIMGFSEANVSHAAKELFKLLRRISISDVLNFLDLPRDLDHVMKCKTQKNLSQSYCGSKSSLKSVPSFESDSACNDVLAVIYTPNSIVINLSCVDLVKQKTEALVCITNCRLHCTEPSSKAVAVAVGSQHKMDCDAYLRDRGPLKPCQVMHTGAGNLWTAVRSVIHAAEPKLEEPVKQHCLLEDLYFNCLQHANDEIRAKSISVPFFSSESCSYKIAFPVVAIAICKAIMTFDELFTDSKIQRTLQIVNITFLNKKAAIIQRTIFDIFLPKLTRYKSEGVESVQTSMATLPPSNRFLVANEDAVNNGVPKNSLVLLWWQNRIKTNCDRLELEISVESGFDGELKRLKVFEPTVLQCSMEKQSGPQKVHHLLKNLLQGDEQTFRKFCQALSSSGQQHIVSHYLVENALWRSEPTIHEDTKLLQRWKVENLQRYHNELVMNIICDSGLVASLNSLSVFTDHQMAELEANTTETNRTRLMLQWLERGSEGTHKKFCAALRKNNQEHLVMNYLLRSILVEYI